MRTAKLIATGCLLIFALSCFPATGWTQPLSGVEDYALLSFRRSLAGTPEPRAAANSPSHFHERGTQATDAIRGNGARAGYVLSHGGVVPGSETVTVDGSLRSRGRDYYIDAANGTLVFAEPIRSIQLIRVVYRYVPQKEVGRTALGGPTLALNIGQNTNVGITYAQSVTADGAFDLMTYGLNLMTKLGPNSSMTNMMYISAAQDSGRVSPNFAGLALKEPSTLEPKSDSAFVHSSDWQSGRLNVKFNVQQIGKEFSGFTTLRQQKVAPDALLGQLEKEKGLKRLGFQTDYALSGDSSAGLSLNKIEDGDADIVRQSLSIGGSRLKLSVSSQQIDKDFNRFKDLAEGEREQWARERGMRRSNIRLGMAPLEGMPADSAWNALDVSEIADQSGRMAFRSLNFAGKGFSLSMRDSKVDKGFARLGDLGQDERAQMALRIKQGFDPNATTQSLTKEELDHVGRETGIERRSYLGSFRMGNASAALQFLSIGDGASGIERNTFSLQGGNYKLTALVQEIDEGFTRTSELAPVERQSLGRENGMSRTNLAAEFKLGSGMLLSPHFSRVTEGSRDAGLVRYGLGLQMRKFSLSAEFRDIDPKFSRVMDLVDSDKERLAVEQGMRTSDFVMHWQPAQSLKIDSSFYNATHSSSDISERQVAYNLDYTPSRGPKMSFQRNDRERRSLEDMSSFLHQEFTLNYGLLSFKAMDISTGAPAPGGGEQIVRTRTNHFETDTRHRVFLIGDQKREERGEGRFEDGQSLKISSQVTKALSFVGVRSEVSTEQGKTESQEYSLTGKVFGDLGLRVRFGETLFNGDTTGKVRELSLVPGEPRDYGIFKQVRWSAGFAQVRTSDKVQTESKAAKVETDVLRHKLVAEYTGTLTKEGLASIVRSISITGDQDPSKRLRYDVAYKVREAGHAPSVLVRRYNLDWQVNAATKLVYNYASYNERGDGSLEPVGTERLKLTTSLTKRLGLIGQLDEVENYKEGTSRTIASLGVSGRISSLGVLEASYGLDRVVTPNGKSTARTYRLKYDYQASADHFFTLTGTYRDCSGSGVDNTGATDDLQLQVDFRTLFN